MCAALVTYARRAPDMEKSKPMKERSKMVREGVTTCHKAEKPNRSCRPGEASVPLKHAMTACKDIEYLVAYAAVQALVNRNTEVIKGILRQMPLIAHVDYDAPKRIRLNTVEDCIFRIPALCLLSERDAAVPGNSNPFAGIKKNEVLSDILLRGATRLKDHELVSLLLEKGADINSTNHEGLTALYIAAKNSDYELVRYLLEKGADVSRRDIFGDTALHYACKRKSSAVNNSDYELIKLLLENGVDVTKTGRRRKTALHIACERRSSAIVKLLTEKSPSYILNLVDSLGNTPFIYACGKQSAEVIRFLLSQGSSVVVKSSYGDDPLMCAVEYNEAEYAISVASVLLEAGAKIDHLLLIAAIKRARMELHDTANYPAFLDFCRLLMDRGCNLNAVDWKGRTALHVAIETNQEILVRKLLISGKDIDIEKRDSEGFTPLLYACRYGYRRMVDVLMICGASLRGQDWEAVFETSGTYKMLKEEQKTLFSYVVDNSKQCLTLENLCHITIRQNIRNIEKDAIKLELPPLLINRLQLKE
ncbi:serine/threonine-protein phosphatase 6 regulatory ankyrin repeat subunit C-like [Stegodyphus dumicola]|uniref:serine/threonine-protein phosphatase 6 regulatory ankyrin repeat subunit C-like n=1 Tax=Stegodyphus dumicola TaxID=202533 RepID=UPI0015A8A367|nr:serine/threonine-protein phosphatase 6 regulatory ankyrin repeat subunit C-like [Stegodyphus dumicola]